MEMAIMQDDESEGEIEAQNKNTKALDDRDIKYILNLKPHQRQMDQI